MSRRHSISAMTSDAEAFIPAVRCYGGLLCSYLCVPYLSKDGFSNFSFAE